MSERQREKGERFRALHAGEPFVIPNPWDAGSAKVFQALGFSALATSSSGFAFTLGRLDGEVSLEEMVDHAHALDQASDLPVSVDLENGYGASPADAATAIESAAAAGAVGGSIEDFDPATSRIYEIGQATERVAAAAEAAARLDFPFTFTARAENQIRDNADLDDTITRLTAYEEAGADVLYAPGLRDVKEIATVCEAVDKPVNVLAHRFLTLEEIYAAGAQRVSVGGSLTWTAITAMGACAEAIRDRGDLSGLWSGSRVYEWLAGGPADQRPA